MTFFTQTESQLWMGGLERYMTEHFIMRAFYNQGVKPTRVKKMKSKSQKFLNYCFVHFETDELAVAALKMLNGTTIPNSSPPAKFQLNFSGPSYKAQCNNNPDDEYTLHVGNLSGDVDDIALHKCFSARYRSLRSAKIIRDIVGFSRGYGFIKFSIQADQVKCLKEMNGFSGLGSKPIKISSALRTGNEWKKVEPQLPASVTLIATDNSPRNEYNVDMWQSYSWQNHLHHQKHNALAFHQTSLSFDSTTDLELFEPTSQVRTTEMNEAILNRDLDFWDAIESSKWLPTDEVSGYLDILT